MRNLPHCALCDYNHRSWPRCMHVPGSCRDWFWKCLCIVCYIVCYIVVKCGGVGASVALHMHRWCRTGTYYYCRSEAGDCASHTVRCVRLHLFCSYSLLLTWHASLLCRSLRVVFVSLRRARGQNLSSAYTTSNAAHHSTPPLIRPLSRCSPNPIPSWPCPTHPAQHCPTPS